MKYEVIVVGGGHAGCEASLACARKGHKTLLITGNIKNIADMPCNPSIGGSAKGIVVREIDALGGEMGRNADKSLLQIKMLNSAKGPDVRALRAQADKITYPKNMIETLNNTPNLEIKEAIVEDLIVEEDIIKGIKLEDGITYMVLDEIDNRDVTYVYLSNIEDEEDFCIRKVDNSKNSELLVGLDSDEEFDKALVLYTKKNQK